MTDKGTIPKHWQLKKLGDVLDIQGGSQPPKSTFIYEPKKSYIQLLQIRDFGKKGLPTYVPVNKVTKFCKKDDILIARYGASLGRIVTGLEGAYNVALAKVIDEKNLFEKRYIFYLLKTQIFQTPLMMLSRSAQNGFSKGEIAPIELPIPPLPEQQAIVSKIEELFSELDNGIAQLKTAQQQLKVYRQSLLKWLYEKSEESVPVKLINACEFITKGTTPAKEKFTSNNGEIPFLKVYNLTFNGSLDFSKDPTFVPKETHDVFLKRSKVYPDDVLMNIVGPPLGKVSIVPNHFPEWNINQAIVRFRCKEMLNNKYLLYFLLCDNTIRSYSRKAKATAGQFNLTLEICRDIVIPLPSLKEQQLIVSELESKLTVCEKIEETISQSLQQAETLRQSILKKAFEGKLVTKQIEKI